MSVCVIVHPVGTSITTRAGGVVVLTEPLIGTDETCSSGLVLLTIAEVNAMPKTGVPDEALMRDNFFMSFTLVLSCYLLGKFVGAVLHLVRRG